MTETPKKRKSSKSAVKGSDSAADRPESSRVGKSKKKTIIEVVIPSPRKRRTESKKAKAKKKDSRNPEANDTKSRNDHPPSSPSPAETHRPVEDKSAHASRRQRSDSDDELILAPKRQPSSKVKLQKGKQKAREPRPVDSDALSEKDPNNEQVATGEEGEEPRNDEGPNTRTNDDHNSRSCPTEPESPALLLVSLISISITYVADPT
jgi:hypothetical protein